MRILGSTGKFIYVNEAYVKMWGYNSQEEIIGTSPDLHSADSNTSTEIISTLREKGHYKLEFKAKKKDGSLFDVLMYTHLGFDKNGAELYFGTAIDITKQKEYEGAVKDSKAFITGVLDNLELGISVIDKDYNYAFINKTLLDISNIKREEAIGKNVFEVLPFLKNDEIRSLMDKAMKGEKTYSEDVKDRIKPENDKWFHMTYYPNIDSQGKIIGIVAQLTDITERKKVERILVEQNQEYEALNEELTQTNEELFKAKELAERSNHLKTVFLNNMSHEIRTPMNGIIGFTSFLENPDLSYEKRKHYSKIVKNSSNQLLRVIDDILEISQLETKQLSAVTNEFSLNDLLMDVFAIFNLKLKKHNIPLYLKKGLSDEDSLIVSDKSKLFKILTNLIENSIKFTREGFIEFGYVLKSDKIELYVKDTGIGISQNSLDLIFQRFVQEEEELSRQFGGLGIGLSIAKENAQLLGGDISVDSEKGKGSIFYVTIPYSQPINEKNANAKFKELIKGEKNRAKKILVVEDEEVNYLYIEELLTMNKGAQIDILHAKNGEEAVNMCKSNHKIDLVFMDLKMPKMDGFEATKFIKEINPDLTIIALTAYSTEEDRNKSLEAGCTDFISKPVGRDKIIEMLDTYLVD